MGNSTLIETFGKTIKDFPETTYWYRTARAGSRNPYNKDGEYLTDINNPHGTMYRADASIGVAPSSGFLNESWDTFLSLTNSPLQLCVNVSNPWDVLTVRSINKITERDYVIQFTTQAEPNRMHPYVVRDCNHYNHAYNRFAKRVREQINPKLGLYLTTVDQRPIEAPAWPKRAYELTTEQFKQVHQWVRTTRFNGPLSEGCACSMCNETYQAFLNAQKEEEQPKVTVEDVVNLMEQITEEVKQATAEIAQNTLTYELWLVTGYGSKYQPELVCGDSDAFFLIERALNLSRTLDDMNPNYRFYITEGTNRTYKATITEGRLLIETGKRVF